MTSFLDPDDEVSVKLSDIKQHPERHRHSYTGLLNCCTVKGVTDTRLVDAHEIVIGRSNGAVACDVTSGPCACGAWH